METKDNIELPPLHYDELPEPDDTIPAMHNYAHRAIKADRQKRIEQAAPPSDDNTLTIAYMCGYNDAIRSTIPEGWQLVPKEPTDEMKKAGCRVPLNKAARHNACYKVMLKAAPNFGEE